MKIKAHILNVVVFTSCLLLLAQASKNLKNKETLHPNVGEITHEFKKMVKPFYQREFFPEEVNSIKEPPKPVYSIIYINCLDFQNAEIVGPQEKGGELDQVFVF